MPLPTTEAEDDDDDSMRMSVRPRMFISLLFPIDERAIAEVDFLLEDETNVTSKHK